MKNVAETVYYCWSCDAHRRLVPAADGSGNCPSCQNTLTLDCRLAGSAAAGERILMPLRGTRRVIATERHSAAA
jgi:hypothetical protein